MGDAYRIRDQEMPYFLTFEVSRREWLKMIFAYHAKSNKRSGDLQFRTQENHAIALFRTKMIETRMNCIHENPVRARIVELPEDY